MGGQVGSPVRVMAAAMVILTSACAEGGSSLKRGNAHPAAPYGIGHAENESAVVTLERLREALERQRVATSTIPLPENGAETPRSPFVLIARPIADVRRTLTEVGFTGAEWVVLDLGSGFVAYPRGAATTQFVAAAPVGQGERAVVLFGDSGRNHR
jgi:hypothetical protein